MPKQLKKNGMQGRLIVSDNALRSVIEGYTREAGVRGLERKLGEICRKAARELLKEDKSCIRVNDRNLEKYLGKPRFHSLKANQTDEIGIVRGLAWTSVGGDTLQIEVNMMPGKGELELTGQLGDVMKESAMTGLSYIRSVSERYQIDPDVFKKNDFHIHIPEGAVPKDGPSARYYDGDGASVCADPYAGSRRSGDDGRNYAAGQSAAHRRIKGKDSGGKDCWNQDSISARKESSGRGRDSGGDQKWAGNSFCRNDGRCDCARFCGRERKQLIW